MDSHELTFVLGDVGELLSDALLMIREVSGEDVELTAEEVEYIDDTVSSIKISIDYIKKELREISEGIG
jgi:hypothetical protein